VLALVETDTGEGDDNGIEYRTGDVTDAYHDGPVLIAHVVNDAARAWGRRGVAAALAAKFPESARAFHAWAVAAPDNLAAGNVHIASDSKSGVRVDIVSLVAQRGYGPRTATRLDYAALRTGLESLADHALRHDLTVHLPRIGTGQAGGRWDMVSDIVADVLVSKGLHVVVHTMPARPGGAKR
jgi:O-acetyl-ADP-ribose deacetylase (regulator of RNase III)